MGADGDVDGVEFPVQLRQGDVLADGDPQLHFHAGGQDGVDVLLQFLPGQPVAGNAVAEHAAQLFPGLKYRDLVAHQGQVEGSGQAAGAAAHHGNGFACGFCTFRGRHDARMVHGIAFQTPDVHRAFDHVPAAAGLAGVLAHQAAGAGEGVVLADQPHGVGVPAGSDQSDVAGNVHACGALGHTGNRLIQIAQAPAGLHMGLVVIPEAPDAFEHHASRFIADGAVSAVGDDLSGALNFRQGVHGGGPVQHIVHQQLQLPQAYPAGYALAAGLGVAQLQEGSSQIHGTQPGRAGHDPVFQIPVKRLHHCL